MSLKMKINSKNISLLVIDALSFCVALWLSLLVRLAGDFSWHLFNLHLRPFSVLLVFYVLVFYIVGLYDLRNFSKRIAYLKMFLTSLVICLGISPIFFYLNQSLNIAPKSILILLVAFFGALSYYSREILDKYYLGSRSLLKVTVIGKGKDVQELIDYLRENPQMGYKVDLWITDYGDGKVAEQIRNREVDVILIPSQLKNDAKLVSEIYRELLKGVDVVSFSEFYETIFGKVSMDELEENWFLEKIKPRDGFYFLLKRAGDIVLAVFILIVTVVFWPIVAFFVKISSPGKVFFKNKRVGVGQNEFIIIKFRTMHDGTGDVRVESRGDKFGVTADDDRVFGFGKFLRKMRIDELPQVLNVLRGELSFVGPRADFTDFYYFLKDRIPHYQVRTILLPGITGWAQVHDKFGSSVEETRERLAYDIYYIKNRSMALDLVIVLKTLKTIFSFSGV